MRLSSEGAMQVVHGVMCVGGSAKSWKELRPIIAEIVHVLLQKCDQGLLSI